jgi:alpha-methylacyl-CoA racemase
MLLSDMGADVVTVARPGKGQRDSRDFVHRGRRVVELDLKNSSGLTAARSILAKADGLIEGFRPGVMERLGLGPDEVLALNQRLVYGRMTGWGQHGPLSLTAGHDINYTAITGALDSFRSEQGDPVSPLNLVGDFGGGALYLVVGVLAALNEVRISGLGQVVDAAICDGVTSMLTYFHSRRALGVWVDRPRSNFIEGASHFYGSYECEDGRYIAIGAVEPQFYATLRKMLELDDVAFDEQRNAADWPELKQRLSELFKTRPRDYWTQLFVSTDACVTPVMSLSEASTHPHLAARETFMIHDGFEQPAPAPRFMRTESSIQGSAAVAPISAAELFDEWA